MLKNIRMGTVVLNQSNFDKSDFELLNASHSPSLILLEEDVDFGGNTLYFVPGDVLRANGGTLKNGTLSGILRIEDTLQQLFQLNNDGQCTVTFAEKMVLNVPFLRPEWFGAKGDLVFGSDENGNISLNEAVSYYDNFTDDSEAINETIRIAEALSIKTMKFNAVNYLVKNGIIIYKGNLHLEGSGALLREDQWVDVLDEKGVRVRPRIWNTRTSTLFCPRGVNLITFGEELDSKKNPVYPTNDKRSDSKNPGDPIVITDLQLWTGGDPWNDYDWDNDYLPSGINFCSNFTGPLWPLIIERCHFRNFYYAIHINTRIDYPVTNLRIDECAFFHNMYCLFSRKRPSWEDREADNEENNENDNVPEIQKEPSLQTSWSLEFTRNKCHGNGFAMKMCVNKGPCRVEYNNLEGMLGFTKGPGSDFFVVDLELGQRAAAFIRYNHFEVSCPRLVSVRGYWPNNWVTMQHNNTDGNTDEYAASDLCYFEGVILNTDEDAEVHNCILGNVPYQGKKLIINEGVDNGVQLPVGSVYMREQPARPLTGGVNRYYKINPQTETAPHTHVYMQTPMGRMLMRYYYEINVNYEHTFFLMSQDFDFEKGQQLYVTIDFPLINECNKQPLVIINELQYAGETVNKRTHTYLYYDKGGFFNVRQQFPVYHKTVSKMKVSLGIKAGTQMPIEGRFFIGNIVVMISNAPLDMNYRLVDDRSVVLTEGDSYLASKGDILPIDGNLNICLEGGYKSSDKFGFYKYPQSNLIFMTNNSILPVGSVWKCGNYTFKIIAPDLQYNVAELGAPGLRYTNVWYQTETDAFNIALNGELECYEPGLISL